MQMSCQCNIYLYTTSIHYTHTNARARGARSLQVNTQFWIQHWEPSGRYCWRREGGGGSGVPVHTGYEGGWKREEVWMGYLFLYSFTQAMERPMTGWWRIIGTGKCVKECDRDRIYDRLATRAFSWREWRKPWTPVRMVGALTDSNYPHLQIQARHVTASVNLLSLSELKLRPFSSFR